MTAGERTVMLPGAVSLPGCHDGVEHMSRRAFVKGVLAGAAGGVIPQIAIGADAPGGAAHPIMDTGPTALSLSEASGLLRQKKISPVELTQACLARIESLNPTLDRKSVV